VALSLEILENVYSPKETFQNTILRKKLNKLFTVFGGKFRFSAQNRDLEYLSWRCKNVPVSSDFNPPLVVETFIVKIADIEFLSLR
jgi:hypothetical protein